MDHPSSPFVVRHFDAKPRTSLSEMVLAWANDDETNEPRWIMELGRDRRGAQCRCRCPSCGASLTAVNAAKDKYFTRPHFRHPNGLPRHECLILAARSAALRQLLEDGLIDLPQRKVSGEFVGLSGERYEVWRTAPPARVLVSQVTYQDQTLAVLTLDDGRTLRVRLTGVSTTMDAVSGTDGQRVPTIFLDISDPAIAGMSPDDLRQRLTLINSSIRWCTHWDDAVLQDDANRSAQDEAESFLDSQPEGIDLHDDLPPELRRETLLHIEVKRILAESTRFMVPEFDVSVQVEHLERNWRFPAQWADITDVTLERRYGRIIPDLTCAVRTPTELESQPLLIEVTVTNAIGDERMERIRSMGAPAVEIDLSKFGGRVSREILRELVVERLDTKRWLYLPMADERRAALLADLQTLYQEEVLSARQKRERVERVLARSTEQVASAYLDAVTAHLDARIAVGRDWDSADVQSMLSVAAERLADAVDCMRIHGYPEAGDSDLVGEKEIVSRILSIQLDRGVGYDLATGFQVVNSIQQMKGPRGRAQAIVALIAIRAYKPRQTEAQQRKIKEWAQEVRDSVDAGEEKYLRDGFYDRILSLLFPEMAQSLADPIKSGKRMPTSNAARSTTAATAEIVSREPNERNFWLRGPALEAWKAANPEAAKAFFKRNH